jgi:hypothetical protein
VNEATTKKDFADMTSPYSTPRPERIIQDATHASVKTESVERSASIRSGADLPCTPPPSSQASRAYDGRYRLGNEDPKPTPTKVTHKIDSSPSPTSRSKVKKASTEPRTLTRTCGVKWEEWEDQMIMKSIVMVGERGTDWHAMLETINGIRSSDSPRTMPGLKQHWSCMMKPKLIR